MQHQFDKSTLSLLTGDEIIQIENVWYGKTFAVGKHAYFVVSGPNEDGGILVEAYDSKEKFDSGAEPKATTIVDRSLVDSNQIVEPNMNIISLIYNKPVANSRLILDDPKHFPIYERESITIEFKDETYIQKNLYALAEEFKQFCCRYDLITTTTTSSTLSSVTAIDSEGNEIFNSINRKSYMAAFNLADHIHKIKN